MMDPWLKGVGKGWLYAPQSQDVYHLTLNDLTVPNVKQWDIQKIKQLFMHDVVLEIMKVPFLEDMKEDCLVWKEESHGNYSVKMGYKLLKKDLSASINLQVEGDWGSLWKIIAPPRNKHLLWRICRGYLPMRIRLRQHFVQCPNNYQLCVGNEEDDNHVFFKCLTTN